MTINWPYIGCLALMAVIGAAFAWVAVVSVTLLLLLIGLTVGMLVGYRVGCRAGRRFW